MLPSPPVDPEVTGARTVRGIIAAGVVACALVVADFVVFRSALERGLVLVVLAVAAAGTIRLLVSSRERAQKASGQAFDRYLDRMAAENDMTAIDAMTGTQFEYKVAQLCRRDGFTAIERTGGAGDLGRDVTAVHPDGRLVVIQCKRVARPVPSGDMQKLVGTAIQHHHADVAVYVSTNGFTAPAAAFGREHGIVLVDRDDLAYWLRSMQLQTLIERRGRP